jgi:hypothetical protein
MATTQGCINDMTKALISAHFALRPHHVASDAQRDEHATMMNTVAVPYLFIRGYIIDFHGYLFIVLLPSQPVYFEGRLVHLKC